MRLVLWEKPNNQSHEPGARATPKNLVSQQSGSYVGKTGAVRGFARRLSQHLARKNTGLHPNSMRVFRELLGVGISAPSLLRSEPSRRGTAYSAPSLRCEEALQNLI